MPNAHDELRKMLEERIRERQSRNIAGSATAAAAAVTDVSAEPVPEPPVVLRSVPAMPPEPPAEAKPEPAPEVKAVTIVPQPVVEPEPVVEPVVEVEPVTEAVVEPVVASKAPKVDADVRTRLNKIISYLARTHKEREGLAHTAAVAAVARQHLLMLSKAGTGKSYLVDDFARHIDGAHLFKVAVDEGTVPDEILGDPNVKALVENGQMLRNTRNKLPEAEIAFIDEFFNANTPTLHAVMPILNERIFTNGDAEPAPIPLRFAWAATNKLTEDPDLAAVMDRLHHRVLVEYVKSDGLMRDLITESLHRRVNGWAAPVATVTLEELDGAHDEAMALPMSEQAWVALFDVKKALEREGMEISTRRWVEVVAAAHAAAWLAGHSEVEVRDLVIMVDMLWRTVDEIDKVRRVVMDRVDPLSRKVLEVAIDLAALAEEYRDILADASLDDMKKDAGVITIFTKVQNHLASVPQDFDIRYETSLRAGVDLLVKIGEKQYGMSPERVLSTAVPEHLRRLATDK
jgi:MoxR-like ATPase